MNLIGLMDIPKKDIEMLIRKGMQIKKDPGKFKNALEGKALAMLFQKTSTRTRISFEAGITRLGGHAIYLDWTTTQLERASLKDEIKCIARYTDIIMARVFSHNTISDIATHSTVPVINGLSDHFHPCQALADMMTIHESLDGLSGKTVAYIGDGNNVCNSLIIACAKLGVHIKVATPKGYEPLPLAVSLAESVGLITLNNDPRAAAIGSDIIYTDTWISMGQEKQEKKRLADFKGYRVDKKMLGSAKFMHCLPAHRGIEVTDEVLDSSQSLVYEQAENRMWVQMSVMLWLMGKI